MQPIHIFNEPQCIGFKSDGVAFLVFQILITADAIDNDLVMPCMAQRKC